MEDHGCPGILPSGRTTVLHYSGVGFFAEVNRLQEEWPDSSEASDAAIVLSLRGAAGIPSATFLKALESQVHQLHRHGIPLVLAGLSPQTRDLLVRTGGIDGIGDENIVAESAILGEALRVAYARAERLRGDAREQNGVQ